jgi:hypothetical protein
MSTTSQVGALLACVILVSLSGCSEPYSKKLVGTWESTVELEGGKSVVVTIEFKPDGGLRTGHGPLELTGTWKVVKEDGKTVTVETEVTGLGIGGETPRVDKSKADKQTLTVVFEDANTVVVTRADGKQTPKWKRKT